MAETKGVIYILTNRSFPEYVKIGYADDVNRRLAELNRSECTPFAFRLYATFEVHSRLTDVAVHKLIDQLNPDLRSIDNYKGKTRIREFFAMSKEDAYSLLEAIAKINGFEDRLKKYSLSEEEVKENEIADLVESEAKERKRNFSFKELNIMPGDELVYVKDESIKCYVINDRKVEFEGQNYYLTGLAKKLTGKTHAIDGALYFKYKGKVIWDMHKK